MHLYIRADADARRGTGHVMRCLALAQAWQEQGGEASFLSRCDSGPLQQRIRDEGFGLRLLNDVCPDPADLETTLSLLRADTAGRGKWLVLDGYHFTPDYQRAIRAAGVSLAVIDDTNHLPYYHADLLLNQNAYAPALSYGCAADTTLLMGTRYCLLRREFLAYRDRPRRVPERAGNLLVTLGGSDPDNATLQVIEALKGLAEPDISVRLVVGPANPHREALRRALLSFPCHAELLTAPSDMPGLMAWADMAISAAGGTCWELAFMQVPTIVLVLAENQRGVAEYLTENEAAWSLGEADDGLPVRLREAFRRWIGDAGLRAALLQKSRTLIDGEGASRVVGAMDARQITLREVTDADSELLWQWANDEETRKASYSQAPIPWDEHVRWFAAIRRQAGHRFYVAQNGDQKPVGQIRLARAGDEAVVSLSVAPEARRRGHGRRILVRAAERLFQESDAERLAAYIKADNPSSLRTFRKAGFHTPEAVAPGGVTSYRMILRRSDRS